MPKLHDLLCKHRGAALTLLTARGLPVSEPVKSRVLGGKDLSLLERWLVRAASAAADTEVVTT